MEMKFNIKMEIKDCQKKLETPTSSYDWTRNQNSNMYPLFNSKALTRTLNNWQMVMISWLMVSVLRQI